MERNVSKLDLKNCGRAANGKKSIKNSDVETFVRSSFQYSDRRCVGSLLNDTISFQMQFMFSEL